MISKGNIKIGYSAFKGCTSLTSVDTKSTNLSVSASVFCGCSSLLKPVLSGLYQYIDKCVSECCPDPDEGGDGKGGKGKSSSCKDNDDTGKSARILGNIDMETDYLGTSPNIHLATSTKQFIIFYPLLIKMSNRLNTISVRFIMKANISSRTFTKQFIILNLLQIKINYVKIGRQYMM